MIGQQRRRVCLYLSHCRRRSDIAAHEASKKKGRRVWHDWV
jgi:hypothetical protein